MVVDLRLPENYRELIADPVIDAEHSINMPIAEELMGKPLYSSYAAYDFNGRVWWHDMLGYWAMEIWQFHEYKMTMINEHLDELVKETQDHYGTA